MSTRISSLVVGAVLAVAACAPESGAPEGPSVECALGEGAGFSAECLLEHAGSGVYTIHHPDASFQRIRYDAAAGTLMAADGADEIDISPDPAAGTFEFAIGTARYRIERRVLVTPNE